MLQRFKNAVSLPLVLFFIAWMLLHAAQSSQAAFHAMQLAAQTLIPAVFPFCVLSAFLFGICHGHPVWAAYAAIFGVVLGVLALSYRSILPGLLLTSSISAVYLYRCRTENTSAV